MVYLGLITTFNQSCCEAWPKLIWFVWCWRLYSILAISGRDFLFGTMTIRLIPSFHRELVSHKGRGSRISPCFVLREIDSIPSCWSWMKTTLWSRVISTGREYGRQYVSMAMAENLGYQIKGTTQFGMFTIGRSILTVQWFWIMPPVEWLFKDVCPIVKTPKTVSINDEPPQYLQHPTSDEPGKAERPHLPIPWRFTCQKQVKMNSSLRVDKWVMAWAMDKVPCHRWLQSDDVVPQIPIQRLQWVIWRLHERIPQDWNPEMVSSDSIAG